MRGKGVGQGFVEGNPTFGVALGGEADLGLCANGKGPGVEINVGPLEGDELAVAEAGHGGGHEHGAESIVCLLEKRSKFMIRENRRELLGRLEEPHAERETVDLFVLYAEAEYRLQVTEIFVDGLAAHRVESRGDEVLEVVGG